MITKWLNETNMSEVSLVGGKNASLGEMISNLTQLGIKVPNGFVVTSYGYDEYMNYNNLNTIIDNIMNEIDLDDEVALRRASIKIKTLVQNGEFSDKMKEEITQKYYELSQQYLDSDNIPQEFTDVAVRSSGTSEDMPDASFAGQQDTFLNVRGNSQLLDKIRSCFASLYNVRAIHYRYSMNYNNNDVKLSVTIQKMVRSDLASSGVAFSIDTESGFPDTVIINSSYGLGEMVVSGQIKPDEFIVYKKKMAIIDKKMGDKSQKMVYSSNNDRRTEIVCVDPLKKNTFSLNEEQILLLSKWVILIEEYYSNKENRWHPVDVEWALDGLNNELYIIQARPETVCSRKSILLHSPKKYKSNTQKNIKQNSSNNMELIQYKLDNNDIKPILSGIAVGDSISQGKVKVIYSIDTRELQEEFNVGDVLVTEITDPDWEPLMKKASAIITEKGGRTCHAAIVARELGVTAIVGVKDCTTVLQNNQEITVSCIEGETGHIYDEYVSYSKNIINIEDINNIYSKIGTKIMMNVASPEQSFKFSKIPNNGVGLAREEFIINNFIKVHPLALLNYDKLEDKELINSIDELIVGYDNPIDYYIKKLSYGIARIATSFYPKDVIVRFSDFKSNEYSNLLGGKYYEPHEENPMIGWRGASRYYSKEFKEAFGLECQAISYVREIMQLDNVIVMIPFCRTVIECQKVLEVMKEYGLERGKNGLKVYLMCELPSNVILANEFCKYVDGFSIGSNDLTQLTLGLDRDSELVSHVYDERNEAVKSMIKQAISICKQNNVKIGICGQAPSDFPDFAEFLINENIDSISLTPDSVCKTLYQISKLVNN